MRKRLTSTGVIEYREKRKTYAVGLTEEAYTEVTSYCRKHGISRSNLLSTITVLFLRGLSRGIGKEETVVAFSEIKKELESLR